MAICVRGLVCLTMREVSESLPQPDRIVLTGFMGSGKTTVGRLLAGELGWQFLDLDGAIEAAAGMSVPEIFRVEGEARFRELETAALSHALKNTATVLALGGGAPETAFNRELLTSDPRTAVVYLAARFETLYRRCREQAADPGYTVRPILASREQARIRLWNRLPLYEAIATHTVRTEGLSAEDTVRELMTLLR